jgi:hypothetical protein
MSQTGTPAISSSFQARLVSQLVRISCYVIREHRRRRRRSWRSGPHGPRFVKLQEVYERHVSLNALSSVRPVRALVTHSCMQCTKAILHMFGKTASLLTLPAAAAASSTAAVSLEKNRRQGRERTGVARSAPCDAGRSASSHSRLHQPSSVAAAGPGQARRGGAAVRGGAPGIPCDARRPAP